jgi:hypothetical protein
MADKLPGMFSPDRNGQEFMTVKMSVPLQPIFNLVDGYSSQLSLLL